MHAVIAGSYDFIESERETYGDKLVDALIKNGYEPRFIPNRGWRWVLLRDKTA